MSKKMQTIDPAERSKIARLQSEIKQESDKKMEWLYSGDKIDRDAYLLGKPINKLLIEKELEETKQPEFVPNTIDLANKIREDPLFEIKIKVASLRKQEIEAKKKILENPLKMKQIEQMLSKSSKKRSSSESSDSESRYRRKKDKKKHKNSRKSHKKYSESEDSEDERRRKKHRGRSRSRERRDGYGLKESRRTDERVDRHSSSASKKHLEVLEYKNRMKKLDNIRKSEVGQSSGTKKLSEEERQRRLKEMEDNAKWRKEVREKNIRSYKNEERKEEELEKKSKSARMQSEAALLFNSMMNDAYASTEDRIKRNVYKVQKSASSLE